MGTHVLGYDVRGCAVAAAQLDGITNVFQGTDAVQTYIQDREELINVSDTLQKAVQLEIRVPPYQLLLLRV